MSVGRRDQARAEELAFRARAWATGEAVSLHSGRRMVDLAVQLLVERGRELEALESESMSRDYLPVAGKSGRHVMVSYAGERMTLTEACKRAGLNPPSVHTLVHRWRIPHQTVLDQMLMRRAMRDERYAGE